MTDTEAYFAYPAAVNQKDRIEKLGFSTGKPDIKTEEEKSAFAETLEQILSIHTKRPEITAFKRISNEECILLTKEIYSNLFDKRYDYFIEELARKAHFRTRYPWYDAEIQYEFNYEGNRQRIESVIIDENTTPFHSIESVHEYGHGLLCINPITRGTLICYQELIPVLLEKIAAFQLIKLQPDIEYKNAQFRSSSTKNAVITYRKETAFLQENDVNHKVALATNHYIDSAYRYIIGDIYSERLLEFYKQDPKEISSRISNIIDRKETLPELLQDLDICLTNPDTIKTYQKSLHKL